MAIQTALDSISQNQGSPFGFKNRIINGGMVIDQRNSGASLTITSTAYTLDRWRVIASQSSKISVQQNAGSVTPPNGFKNYFGITSLSSYSIASGEIFSLQHKIEGYNVADLGYGTTNASTVTLSFWVRSSLTGTFGGVFTNEAADRCYIFSYTINSANTWEQKTITVPGDTTGTWLTTNGTGLDIRFNIGSGSDKLSTAGSWGSTFYNSVTSQTSVVGTNGATFYITGVQLEKGNQATSFDYRPYGTELALCHRYAFAVSGIPSGSYARKPIFGNGSNTTLWYPQYPVAMRIPPALSAVSITNTYMEGYNYSTATSSGAISNALMAEGDNLVGQVALYWGSGFSAGHVGSWRWTSSATSANYFLFNAEL